MKRTLALTALFLAAATGAWAHPGHGAVGEAHHVIDLLALGGIAAVIAVAWAGRSRGGNDHD